MNTKNRAEWLRASLCLKKGERDESKLFACDTVGVLHVTQRDSTTQVTCIDGHLSSGADQTAHHGQGSQPAKLNRAYGADSFAQKGYAEVSA